MTITTQPTIQDLWQQTNFTPNPAQEQAILHTDGPLYLTAGPGSGKTRVLLWRTLNLIVYHNTAPEDIFLSTFTEKAALQLSEGLQTLLGLVTNATGVAYNLGEMYIGTVHSLCQRLIGERRLSPNRHRVRPPRLLDALDQYFHLTNTRNWQTITAAAGLDPDQAATTINTIFGQNSESKHVAVTNCMSFFNRLSEEHIDPASALMRLTFDADIGRYFTSQQIDSDNIRILCALARAYHDLLDNGDTVPQTNFSRLQEAAYSALLADGANPGLFRHIIVDEYQDTNAIQERIFFTLAERHRNICVVGDDDQALYRFRGATVENFVQFPDRCLNHLGVHPRRLTLATNYRSRQPIVDFYTNFIDHCNWRAAPGSDTFYRVVDKNIRAYRTTTDTAVVATTAAHADTIYADIANLVRNLIDEGKVEDPNQIAFLFPSLKSAQVQRMIDALERVGLAVYAPRAGTFLDVPESVDIFGVFAAILGIPAPNDDIRGRDYATFQQWLQTIRQRGQDLLYADPNLAHFVAERRQDIATAVADYQTLTAIAARNRWDLQSPYDLNRMKRALLEAPNLSPKARSAISSQYLDRLVQRRQDEGQPYTLRAIINRAASIDWSLLDLFYRICGFAHFRAMFDLAEDGIDEGPICNLGLITQYLSRFMDRYTVVITGEQLVDNLYVRLFYLSFLFALYRLGEAEYEVADDPFPRGRIPFLTVHQSKGLEFPVVVLPNLRKDDKGPHKVETFVRPFLSRAAGEPLERMTRFDIMRMFYVALSRAKNLLVLGHLKAQGQRVSEPFKTILTQPNVPRIEDLDIDTVPAAAIDNERLPQSYSFTSDYLAYQKCPRQYMVFRKYNFVPSRSQTMFFGSLVHSTLEDLHNALIARRSAP